MRTWSFFFLISLASLEIVLCVLFMQPKFDRVGGEYW